MTTTPQPQMKIVDASELDAHDLRAQAHVGDDASTPPSELKHLVRNEVRKDEPVFYLVKKSTDRFMSYWRVFVVHRSELKELVSPELAEAWCVVSYNPDADLRREVIGRVLVESDVDIEKLKKVKAVIL